MDEEIDRLVVSVRADTAAFARDVADMRAGLDGALTAGADRAGRTIEAGLLRAVRTGKLGFDDLRRTALSVLAEIAQAALASGLDALGGGARGGGTGALIRGLAAALTGLPGRATGGPVAPGAAYVVGERGPELFVPTTSGRVLPGARAEAAVPRAASAAPPAPVRREVHVSIRIDGRGGGAEAPVLLARSGRQVARAVRAAIEGID